jgi:hypothetical protein
MGHTPLVSQPLAHQRDGHSIDRFSLLLSTVYNRCRCPAQYFSSPAIISRVWLWRHWPIQLSASRNLLHTAPALIQIGYPSFCVWLRSNSSSRRPRSLLPVRSGDLIHLLLIRIPVWSGDPHGLEAIPYSIDYSDDVANSSPKHKAPPTFEGHIL